jgi:hypothetical protein
MNHEPVLPRRSLFEFLSDALPRLLFGLAWIAAAGLISLVLLCPALDNGEGQPAGWRRTAALFARDVVMRRTAVAGAVGLIVTACVFFRTPRAPRPPRPAQSSSGPVIGA